jgi:ribonuclease-3
MPHGDRIEGRPDPGALQSRSVLVERLGVDIDPELLQLALTHRSFAYENGGLPHNERLEFLGDSILGQAVTVRLYLDNPELDEGALAKRRSSLVSGVALAEVARALGLGDFLRLGRGEELTGGRDKVSILADTVEAVIGATYLSAGADEATALVLRLVAPLMNDPERFGAALDPKTALQELADRSGAAAPVYLVEGTGPDHAKVFHATVTVAGLASGAGDGTSKKHAEMAAALDAWNRATGAQAANTGA